MLQAHLGQLTNQILLCLQLVDLNSDSDLELPNPKRTPVAAAKRKRAFVQEDSPEAIEHDRQV